jgi:hypothetical protein
MSSPFYILHNKMELLKGKIELSLKPQGQCLMNTMSRRAEAINTACHAINRLYLHKILNKTAYELLLGKKPNVS